MLFNLIKYIEKWPVIMITSYYISIKIILQIIDKIQYSVLVILQK